MSFRKKHIDEHRVLSIFVALSIAAATLLVTVPVASAVEPGCYTEGAAANETPTKATCPSPDDEARVARGACLMKRSDSSTFVSVDCDSLLNSASTDIDNPDVTSTDSSVDQNAFTGGKASLDSGATDSCAPGGGQSLNSDNCAIIRYLVMTINFLSAVALMSIIGSIMFAGYQYMTAQDNSGAIQAAKKRITWALVALGLFIFMYSLLDYALPGGLLT
ncbi:MAG TPA: hypothetical protein PKD15_01175 [Candidatus Saccharibacteria bacterium]|mgnify:CR=1 FL=1|jgi:hypothetical protein|nr:hypothetical protein [Candidatus Saccharibacteria bacterium]